MAQQVTLKLKSSGPNIGPFQIWDDFGNLIAEEISKQQLRDGITFSFSDNVNVVVIKSTGKVPLTKSFGILEFTTIQYADTKFSNKGKACLWRHVDDPLLYNSFYGNIEPYVIEYPFSSQYQDQIVQSVQDYTKVYQYIDTYDNVFNDYSKIELDDAWFNKAVLYNGQQSSGILTLESRPVNNLFKYMQYPVLKKDEKIITFTKSDNFYQYNTFWSITKDNRKPQFIKDCSSLSVDKHVDQDNMDYTLRTHQKATLRAKELKVRHIMDNRDDIHLVSQFVVVPQQISYK